MARTPAGTPPRASSSAAAPAAASTGRLSTYRPFIDRAIFVLALVGLAVVSHIAFQSARGMAGGCSGFDPNNLDAAPSGCATVLSSTYATAFGGVSNTLLGLVFYGIVALLSAAIVVAPEMLPMLKRVRGGILVVGAAYALYLIGILVSGAAGGLCTLCLISHALTLAMAALFVSDARHA